MNRGVEVRYRINERDKIVFVNEAWDRFAVENDGAELVGKLILGRSLWDFITDESTCQLYRHLLARVRQGSVAQFTMHCDSPTKSRLLEMTVSCQDARTVDFATRVLEQKHRPPMNLLARNSIRSDAFLRICAWCNRVETEAGDWLEVEEAMYQMRFFESDRMPQITHGMCRPCFASMSTIPAPG